jgi:hypothetical protein
VYKQEKIATNIHKIIEARKKSPVIKNKLFNFVETTVERKGSNNVLKTSIEYKRSLSYDSICNRMKKRNSIEPVRNNPSFNKILPPTRIASNLNNYNTQMQRRVCELNLNGKKDTYKLKDISILKTRKSEESAFNCSFELSEDIQFAKMANFIMQLRKIPSITSKYGSTNKLNTLTTENRTYKRAQLIKIPRQDNTKSILMGAPEVGVTGHCFKDLMGQAGVTDSAKLNFPAHRNSQAGTKKALLKFIERKPSVKNEANNKKVAQNFCSVRSLLSIISKKFSNKQTIPSPLKLRKDLHVQSHEHMKLVPKIKAEWPLETVKLTVSEEVFWISNDFLLI